MLPEDQIPTGLPNDRLLPAAAVSAKSRTKSPRCLFGVMSDYVARASALSCPPANRDIAVSIAYPPSVALPDKNTMNSSE